MRHTAQSWPGKARTSETGPELLVIHPGFPKSGTTTLQKGLFARHPSLTNLAKPWPAGEEDRFFDLWRDDVKFDPACLPQIHEDGRVHVISDEAMTKVSGKPGVAVGRGEIARRLHEKWPDAHILFTIRNQLKAVPSHQGRARAAVTNAPHPYTGRPVTFEDWIRFQLDRALRSELGLFDYWPVVSFYVGLFGRQNVTVIPSEWLFDSLDRFASVLAPLLRLDPPSTIELLSGTRRNVGPTVREATVKRARAIVPITDARVPAPARVVVDKWARRGRRRARPTISPSIARELSTLYGPGNAMLAETFDLPLAELGYPVSTEPVV